MAVMITCPIPQELLADKDNLVVVCIVDGELVVLPTQVVIIDGVYCVQFTATHFSPYAIVIDSEDSKDTSDGVRTPTVVTESVSNITYSGAAFMGRIRSMGSGVVTERGFVIATTPGAVLGGDGVIKIALSGSKGSFTAETDTLLPAMTYYVRAYAINSAGIGYGVSIPLSTGYVGDGKCSIPKTGDGCGAPFLICGVAALMCAGLLLLHRRTRNR